MKDRERILERAERALAQHAADAGSIEDPLLPATLRYLDAAHGGQRDRSAVLRWWPTQAPGGTRSDRRFRWDVVWDGYPTRRRTWARNEAQERTLWRPRENGELEHDPTAFSERLLLPIVLTETLEFLEEIAADEPALAGEAARLRDEALPLMEDDFAEFVGATDPWRDTFALWQLTRHARALERLDPLAIATATRYATRARREGGIVRGVRFPFFEAPLRSASAHLAGALWTLGIYPTLLPDLVGFAGGEQHPDGGWGDPDQPSDVLTTLAIADLRSHLDPNFDPEPVVRFFAQHQEPAGWWRALDPETPWLTAEVCRWLRAIDTPFAARFRWPRLAKWQRDRKTQLPLFAFYQDLARVAAELDDLGQAHVEVAFIDLVGFGDWNKTYGQESGDQVLAVLADALRAIPDSLVVRDGGDEFLVIGAPTGRDVLAGRMAAFVRAWPDRFRAAFGADIAVVPPRMAILDGRMDGALQIREQAGIEVGRMKLEAASPAA